MRHMTITVANTPPSIQNSLASTVSLVAAMTPTLPAASLNCAPGTWSRRANASPRRPRALWFLPMVPRET